MGFFDKKPQQPQPSQKQVTGRINSVRCPWCGKPNDFRGIDSAMLLDKGSEFDCDHCGHVMLVVQIEQPKLVTVIQHPEKTRPVPRRPGDRR